MKRWFMNRLLTIMKHNNYTDDMLDVSHCNAHNKWTPCDLIAREYLNNGGASARGFLGISKTECIRSYNYMREIKEELLKKNYVNESAWNNSGIRLWKEYNF